MILFWVGCFFICVGFLFNIISVVGLIRIEDMYNKLHISALNDMFASPMIVFGCMLIMLSYDMYRVSLKLFLVIILTYIMNPVNTYSIVKTIYFYKKNKKL